MVRLSLEPLHCCVCVQLRRLGRTPHSSFAKKALIISSGIKLSDNLQSYEDDFYNVFEADLAEDLDYTKDDLCNPVGLARLFDQVKLLLKANSPLDR